MRKAIITIVILNLLICLQGQVDLGNGCKIFSPEAERINIDGRKVYIRSNSEKPTALFLDNTKRNWAIMSHTGNFYVSDITGQKDIFCINTSGTVGIGAIRYPNALPKSEALYVEGNATIKNRLHVKSHLVVDGEDSTMGRILRLKTTDTEVSALHLDTKKRNWAIMSHTGSFYISDLTGKKDVFCINTNGTVGIGTIRYPSALPKDDVLYVEGNATVKNRLGVKLINFDNSDNRWQLAPEEGGTLNFYVAKTKLTPVIFKEDGRTYFRYKMGIGTHNPKSMLHIGASYPKITFGEPSNVYKDGRYSIDVPYTENDDDRKFRITIPGKYTFLEMSKTSSGSAKVKINSHASSLLTVVGTTDLIGKLYVNPGNSREVAVFRSNHADGPYAKFGNDTYFGESKGIGLVSSGNKLQVVSKMIHLNGQVGIGTSNPSARLDIVGSTNTGSILHVSHPEIPGDIRYKLRKVDGIVSETRNVMDKAALFKAKFSRGYGTAFAIVDGEDKLKFSISDSGNIYGKPSLGLTTSGGASIGLSQGKVNISGSLINLNGSVSGASSMSATVKLKSFEIDKGGWAAFHAKPTPGVALAVNGAVNLKGFQVDKDGWAAFNATPTPGVTLTINGSTKINYSLGIGCNPQPGFLLAAKGKVKAEEVEISVDGWADFVFDDNYQLMPLEQVEQQIKQHKHLPDIPSEAEVKKNGVPVGKMQTKLLQKIEELTLYTINQEKKIKSQEQKMELQDKRIELLEKLVKKMSTK
ncbi:hypothetical protein [Candidatus Uabimicrobium amorphum]|uniref:Peptidase S74 domain-containing protein n=1 Tax=Uabimicrobium amorphum TaxID=2596890 RepID=A0A5S9IRJ3_UABAM|nr:hypothetical protein [Candidatus Uabimicrobium amorphum]BBM86141.1 hypothetical protein UABAM_04527 [Candidatus Uabimicrobium amorphum]